MLSSRKTASSSSGYKPPTAVFSKSLRFRSSASAYFNRTFSSTPTSWTASFWVKRGTLGSYQSIFGSRLSGTGSSYLEFLNNDTLGVANNSTSVATNAVYRDPSAWYHFVVSWSSSNVVVIYCNGVSQSLTGSISGANQLFTSGWTSTVGRYGDSSSQYFDGELADIYFIDGQVLTPSSFGTTYAPSGQWIPIAYSGTYGTNGFHLPFNNTTSTTTLGYDTSGNSNNWTTNNISLTAGSTYDSMNDVPVAYSATAANYCVINPNANSGPTITNGNLNQSGSSGFSQYVASTMGMSASGKYYCELTCVTLGSEFTVGICTDQGSTNYVGGTSTSWGYYTNGNKYNNGSGSAYGATYTSGDLIGVAFDAGAGTLTFYKNGTSQGTAFTGLTSGTYFFTMSTRTSGGASTGTANFGQQPFTYTPPSGYVALNTYNLPTPTIAQGNKYMDATTYTGTGVSQNIVNAGGFKPDLVWAKVRNQAYGHALFDSVRGAGNALQSNSSNAEAAWGATTLSSFNSNGFGLGADTTYLVVNSSGNTFVGWQWQAGQGSSSSNTNGSITSTVSASTTAGFSVVTYTGTGSNATVGHGLGVAPSMVIVKVRSTTNYWLVYHIGLTSAGYYIVINSTNGQTADSTIWNSTAPTSSVFSIGTDTSTNLNTGTFVAYCFAPIAGYSAFGKYTGNGSSTGPFVYLGFEPRWIMIKYSSANGDSWQIFDSARSTYNTLALKLQANLSNAESTASPAPINFLSNGFQIVDSNSAWNSSSGTYIYAAFASNPFQYSNAF